MLNGSVLYCGSFKGIINYSQPGGTKRGVRMLDTALGGYHLFIVDGAENDLDEMSKVSLVQDLADLLYNNGITKLPNRPDRFSLILD